MSDYRIQVYPSLLNDWARYRADLMEKDELLARINRVPVAKTAEQLEGIAFEDALIRHASGETVEEYKETVLNAMAEVLPNYAVTQHFVEFIHKDIRFYGKTDVVGEGRVIDIKVTGQYPEPRYMRSFQNLYLYALREQCHTMEYLITDLRQVYHEVYHISSYDFTPLLLGMEDFVSFCDDHKELITDPRLYVTPLAVMA